MTVLAIYSRVFADWLKFDLVPPDSSVDSISEQLDVRLGREAAMVPALGTYVQASIEAITNVHMPAFLALLPRVMRDLTTLTLGRPRLAFFFEPGHHRHRLGIGKGGRVEPKGGAGTRTILGLNGIRARPELLTYCYISR